jgi:type III pantothenate kinase
MHLVIDIGNTRTKVFVFNRNNIVAAYSFRRPALASLKKILTKHRIEGCILSSVVKKDRPLLSFLSEHSHLVELNYKTPLPLVNLYSSKKTLGNDRIANAAGAAELFPRQNCLTIDAGTCVKYDFINARREYLGGAISPGLSMRYAALHDYTSQLPLLKPGRNINATGTSTKSSIRSGVQQGMLNEMEGYIMHYQKRYKTLKVILTGGDAGRFAHLLNFPIFAAPKLTAIGLNEILQHNLPKK